MLDDEITAENSEMYKNVNIVYACLFGLPEAFLIHQINFWTLHSKNIRDGHRWTYHTYDEWCEEIPFWNKRTIQRAVKKLEDKGIIVTDNFNKLPFDQTKWYRLNTNKLREICKTKKAKKLIEQAINCMNKNYSTKPIEPECKKYVSNDFSDNSSNNSSDHSNYSSECSNRNDVSKDARKERSMSKKQTEKSKEVTEVIEYLNTKTGARYKPSSHANRTLIIARMNEGYTVQDLKTVIDNQVSAWRGTEWEKYLRPSTLFRASKIENYLNSKRLNHSQRYNSTVQDQYDNLQYTDLSKEDLSDGPF